MRTFEVFTHTEKGNEAVKKGFSWPGFFFGFIWAFVKGLPGIGFLLIIAAVGLRVLEAVAVAERSSGMMVFVALLYLAVLLVVGFQGNNWRRSKLTQKGYILTKAIDAANPDAAIATTPRDAGTGKESTDKTPNTADTKQDSANLENSVWRYEEWLKKVSCCRSRQLELPRASVLQGVCQLVIRT